MLLFLFQVYSGWFRLGLHFLESEAFGFWPVSLVGYLGFGAVWGLELLCGVRLEYCPGLHEALGLVLTGTHLGLWHGRSLRDRQNPRLRETLRRELGVGKPEGSEYPNVGVLWVLNT